MKRVKVLIPFHSKALNKDLVPDDVIEVNDEQLANIRSVNVNMVVELGEEPIKVDEEETSTEDNTSTEETEENTSTENTEEETSEETSTEEASNEEPSNEPEKEAEKPKAKAKAKAKANK